MSARPRRAISSRMAGVRVVAGTPSPYHPVATRGRLPLVSTPRRLHVDDGRPAPSGRRLSPHVDDGRPAAHRADRVGECRLHVDDGRPRGSPAPIGPPGCRHHVDANARRFARHRLVSPGVRHGDWSPSRVPRNRRRTPGFVDLDSTPRDGSPGSEGAPPAEGLVDGPRGRPRGPRGPSSSRLAALSAARRVPWPARGAPRAAG